MPDETSWVTLYNPTIQGTHRVPNNPIVVDDFRSRGWETSEDTAARTAADAEELRGKALDEALEAAGLSQSGLVEEKRTRLAEHEAELAANTTEEGSE